MDERWDMKPRVETKCPSPCEMEDCERPAEYLAELDGNQSALPARTALCSGCLSLINAWGWSVIIHSTQIIDSGKDQKEC